MSAAQDVVEPPALALERAIDWPMLRERKAEIKAQFNSGENIRFVVIDDFLPAATCKAIADGFHVLDAKRNSVRAVNHKHVRGKLDLPRRQDMTDPQQAYFADANGPQMRSFLEYVTDLPAIYADDDLVGGGLHEICRGGYLNVHTDFNLHSKTGRYRRLNLLVYLNPDWEDSWNGHIELWSNPMMHPVVRLAPKEGRALLFETSDTSFHGHPEPLNTPEGLTRKSLATYYYSDWPVGVEARMLTNYQLTPPQWSKLMAAVAALMYGGQVELGEVLQALELNYQRNDIETAYRTLLSLRSHELAGEPYLEYPDGHVSLK